VPENLQTPPSLAHFVHVLVVVCAETLPAFMASSAVINNGETFVICLIETPEYRQQGKTGWFCNERK
jgi:hypothetical protein